jgi:hypothetical protein
MTTASPSNTLPSMPPVYTRQQVRQATVAAIDAWRADDECGAPLEDRVADALLGLGPDRIPLPYSQQYRREIILAGLANFFLKPDPWIGGAADLAAADQILAQTDYMVAAEYAAASQAVAAIRALAARMTAESPKPGVGGFIAEQITTTLDTYLHGAIPTGYLDYSDPDLIGRVTQALLDSETVSDRVARELADVAVKAMADYGRAKANR